MRPSLIKKTRLAQLGGVREAAGAWARARAAVHRASQRQGIHECEASCLAAAHDEEWRLHKPGWPHSILEAVRAQPRLGELSDCGIARLLVVPQTARLLRGMWTMTCCFCFMCTFVVLHCLSKSVHTRVPTNQGVRCASAVPGGQPGGDNAAHLLQPTRVL